MKYWILPFSLLVLGGMQTAKATGVFSPANSAIQLPADISVSDSTPVRSIIWRSNETSSILTNEGFITGGLESAQIVGQLVNSTSSDGDISPTSLPGIGVRWRATWRAPAFPNGQTMSISNDSEGTSSPANYNRNSRFSQTVWMELVKTGPVQSGNLSVPSSVQVTFFCLVTTRCNPWNIRSSGNTRVNTIPACFASTAIDVAMPLYFPRPNAPTSSATPFSLVLTCEGGDANSATIPLVTLTDANNRANTSNILSLTPLANAATGVGIQILRDNQPITLGPEDSAAAQWEAGTVNQGTSVFEIPLAARYVATGATVSPGIANGRAIFTLNYR